ncbi:MAG TPA: TonB-dependent receptor [Burkholderiaceae bacterium]|nr:TonB-dependent receptor [Burkholderiaceae bacterium]
MRISFRRESRPRAGSSCLVSSLFLALLSSAAAHAQSTGLNRVVVTATRTPVSADDQIAEVTVINREQLDRIEGRTLVEVLALQPGVQFTSNGGMGKSSGLFIRGLEARHTLLLVDGVRVGSATLGTPSLDNLPLESIERIEIVRGPLSGLYGSDAVGGVVQIFTRRGTNGFAPNAKVAVGSHEYAQGAAGVAFGQGVFDGAVQVQRTYTTGFSATRPGASFGSYNPDNDGFGQTAGSVRGGVAFGTWRLDALALDAVGKSRYDDGPGADARSRLRNSVQSFTLAGPVLPRWNTTLRAGRSRDAYDTLSSASAFATLGQIETVQKQYSWENIVATPLGTALGLIERIEQDVSRPETPYDVSDRTIDAVALGLNGAAGAHAWQGSLRHDSNSQFGDQTTGAAGYSYAFAPAWRAGVSYGTSFVAPSFNQLYYPGFGNPNLLPEEGKHTELSLAWATGGHAVRAAWFDHRIRGYITSGPSPTNVPRTHIDGVSLSYEGRIKALMLGASFDAIDPRNATEGSVNNNKQLPRRARRIGRLLADWDAGAWSVGATLAGYSGRYDDSANTRHLSGYTTVDLRADWKLARDWTLGARLNNVTDRDYETAFGYNQPRREAYLVLRYALR